MSEIALCKCGVDMTWHGGEEMMLHGHLFDAAGTKHRCFQLIDGYACARPAYHEDEEVPCGPLTGEKLW